MSRETGNLRFSILGKIMYKYGNKKMIEKSVKIYLCDYKNRYYE